ncbi:MAG: 50S ribosomal protein L25 [Bacteroidales bacterium]|jgi:large subunit ribosomal protein L25|nr:50S ribosomal protein L25 [Bacteroidales bacterium]
MKHFELKAELRTNIGKKACKAVRKENGIPCVIYGGTETIHISTNQSDVRKLIYTPEVLFADITVNGKTYISIVKDVQYHPTTDKILHIDFYEVSTDKPMKIAIPLKLIGSSVGVKAGGKLQQKIRKITVKSLMENIPENFTVDISELNIGQSMRIRDLVSDTLEFVDAKPTIIALIASSRGAVAADTDTEPAK